VGDFLTTRRHDVGDGWYLHSNLGDDTDGVHPAADVRETATRQLETASRENFVRSSFNPHHYSSLQLDLPSVAFFALSMHITGFISWSFRQHGYLHTLAAELANEQGDTNIRRAAGLAFKNGLAARVRILLA